jgi:hypothetical protein
MATEAEVIAGALQLWRPESPVPAIARALTALRGTRFLEATRILEREALPLEPENRTIAALIGLALRLGGMKHESDRVLAAAAATGPDRAGSGLARALLADSDRVTDDRPARAGG